MVAILFLACCGKDSQPVESAAAQTERMEEEANPTFDFNTMVPDTLSQFKGGEGTIFMKIAKAGANKIMLATLPKGTSVGYHSHDNDMEAIYVLQGSATILLDSTELVYTAGMVHYCAKGHSHSISNRADEDLITYNIVATQN